MPSYVSPGVYVREVDLSTVVPAASTSLAAFVGNFNWGPVDQATTVSSETKLAEWFGKPSKANPCTDFLTVASFLSYSGAIRVVRAVDKEEVDGAIVVATARNADSATDRGESSSSDTIILNESQVEDNAVTLDALPSFVARYPGALGNALSVVVIPGSARNSEGVLEPGVFGEYLTEINPATAEQDELLQYIAAKNFDSAPEVEKNEVHVVVFDVTGVFSGTPNSILEKYAYIQLNPGAKKEDGSNNYIQDVIALGSSYIYVGEVPEDAGPFQTGGTFNLGGGVDSVTLTDGDIQQAWGIFANQEEQEDVSLLICGAVTPVTANFITNIAINRTDCVAFISPERTDVVGIAPSAQLEKVKEFRNLLNLDTSYAFLDSGWKYVYNKYLDRYEWIPLCGDTAGLCARTDTTNDPWFSPAGYNRGNIKNAVKLAFNPDKAARDELYKNGINPVVNFRGTGPILYGDKTLQTRPSAFDRINVRRLFIVLERVISKASKYQLFEFNDQFTRAQFVNIVEPFLRDVQARRGIYDYKVVADETNNTPQVIDSNTFVGDIYIKPARSINFIQLSFVAVRTGVSFTEVVGKF